MNNNLVILALSLKISFLTSLHYFI